MANFVKSSLNNIKDIGSLTASHWVQGCGNVILIKTLRLTELVIFCALAVTIYFGVQISWPLTSAERKNFTGSEWDNRSTDVKIPVQFVSVSFVGMAFIFMSIILLNAGIDEKNVKRLAQWKIMRLLYITLAVSFFFAELIGSTKFCWTAFWFVIYSSVGTIVVHLYREALIAENQTQISIIPGFSIAQLPDGSRSFSGNISVFSESDASAVLPAILKEIKVIPGNQDNGGSPEVNSAVGN